MARVTKALKLRDFQGDYAHFVIRLTDKRKLFAETQKLIRKHYAHIAQECVDWLHKEHNVQLSFAL